MTVLFVTTDYIKKGQPTTGLPAYLYRVSQSLLSMGHTPLILVVGSETDYKKRDGVEVYTAKIPENFLKNESVNYLCKSIMQSWFINKEIEKLVRNRGIDIIQFASLNGLAMFYKCKIPAVLRLSSYAKTYFQTYSTLSKNLVGVMSYVERLAAKRCNAIFAPCQITADAYGKDCNRKVYVIETPFINDVEVYNYSLYKKIVENKKYFLFFGSLYIEKGILVIGEILEKVLELYPDYYFVFIGKSMQINGRNATSVIKESAGRYKDRVIVCDAMNHQSLYPFIMNADLIILPSLMDNFPNACVEAMYFSKIVIGTDGASFEQLISDKVNGILCKPNDSADLLEKISYVMRLNVVQKRLIEENAKKRIEQLKPEIAVKRLVNFYKKVIDNA